MTRQSKIVLVGAGNVATHLGERLKAKGFSILQVYSHTLASAEALGQKLGVSYTNDIRIIDPDADIYIFSLKDSALPEVLEAFPKAGGLLLHTAGSLPLSVFEGYGARYGVLYPLQTFSKNRPIDFDSIPLFIESNNDENLAALSRFAHAISPRVYPLSTEKRKTLHLAAVFACNFVNHLYAVASDLLEEQDISRQVLLPLIEETARKIETLGPHEAQTGPAVRHDENTLALHRGMLEGHPRLLEFYNLISKSIQEQ